MFALNISKIKEKQIPSYNSCLRSKSIIQMRRIFFQCFWEFSHRSLLTTTDHNNSFNKKTCNQTFYVSIFQRQRVNIQVWPIIHQKKLDFFQENHRSSQFWIDLHKFQVYSLLLQIILDSILSSMEGNLKLVLNSWFKYMVYM